MRILFATGSGPASAETFPYVLSLAEDYRAKLVRLHMVPPMPVADLGSTAHGPSACAAQQSTNWKRTMRDESVRKLRVLVPTDTNLAERPEYLARTDLLSEGILDAAVTHRIELIVVGANRTPFPMDGRAYAMGDHT
jgi:hypothetical protein